MSIQLRIDELLEIIQIRVCPQKGTIYESMLLHIANDMANCIRDEADHDGACPFTLGEATMQGVDFAGLCVPFHPADPENIGPVPELIADYDDGGWE